MAASFILLFALGNTVKIFIHIFCVIQNSHQLTIKVCFSFTLLSSASHGVLTQFASSGASEIHLLFAVLQSFVPAARMEEGLEDDKEGLVRKAGCALDTWAPNPLATTHSCDPKLTAREAGKCSLPIGPDIIDEHLDNFDKYLYIGGFIAYDIFLDWEIST